VELTELFKFSETLHDYSEIDSNSESTPHPLTHTVLVLEAKKIINAMPQLPIHTVYPCPAEQYLINVVTLNDIN
jgi:hypothetical protein